VLRPAAVAADTIGQAREALELVQVDWEVLEPTLDPDEAVRLGRLTQEPRRNERGDFDAGLAQADAVVEATYRTQSVLHNSLETHQAVVQWVSDGVEVHGETVRARSIGEAIVSQAHKRGSDLIVVGSAPRWRRQSRFFSPTVEYVLRKAPCEVLVVAFPQGVLEEDGAGP